MFAKLSEGFSNVFKRLSGQSTLTEANVREAMGQVREALLEADVHRTVAEEFCESVVRDSLGEAVLKSLRPGEQVIGVVYRRLVELLGGQDPGPDDQGVMKVSPGPAVVMMCGLQGSGKTTTCGKLAAYLKKRGRSVMLCAADLQRPAAVEQLEVLASRVRDELPGGATVHFHAEPEKCAEYGRAVGVAVQVCRNALAEARKRGVDVLILDTAGRLHVNDELMGELHQVRRAIEPHHVFLVVDAMTGQDAVNSARAFHQRLDVDGVILTKFDSDTRGGAAISVRRVTGAPIRYLGVGERLDALEEFHAERIAGRVLGMGDVVSLVERAQQEVSEEEAERLQAKMAKGQISLEDFLSQLRSLRRMGPLKQLLGLLPGMSAALGDVTIDDSQLDRVEAMIRSMTREERERPEVIDNSRRRRIARGSGSTPEAVGQLVKQFTMLTKMTRAMAGLSAAQKVRAVKELSGDGGLGSMLPGVSGLPGLRSRGSTQTKSVKDRFKKRKR